jgi:radical SAM superfamily enzyme YgiQ (UPF0313 family)
MKSISLVQPNFRQGPVEVNAYYLPYTVGVIWSYANKFEKIKNNYKINEIIFRRDPIEKVAETLKNDFVVAFSVYVWNKNYSFELAKLLKKINPSCILIFGGPEIPIEDSDIFAQYPFMDYVIKNEGEISFKDLLEKIIESEDKKTIPGILINDNGNLIDTGIPKRIDNLNEIPSPYIEGIFDKIITDNPGVEWNATLETNRGCPYACTFCDWGSLTYSKVKKFELERVFQELEWIGKNKCGFVTVTDANFGIFIERDDQIADKLLEVQSVYGYPYTFSVTWAKNQKDEVINIVKKLISSEKFNQGLTVSVQSMNLDVLENIKRKNLEQHRIKEILRMCELKKVPTYTELILGLPGETLNSWKENFWQLFESGAHTGINIFQAQLFVNAEMNLLQKKLYDLKSQTVYDYMSGSYEEDIIKEGVDVVISTKHMSFQEMLDAQVFSWFLNTFHINGYTNFISRVLFKAKGITYKDFYNNFFIFLQKKQWFFQEQETIRFYYNKWMTEGKIDHPKIGGIEIHGWNLIHKTILKANTEHLYDQIFFDIQEYLEILNLEKFMIEDLIEFQKSYIITFDKINQYPFIKHFNLNILEYLNNDSELLKSTNYQFDFPENKQMSKETFLENIYYRRRRNFGKALVE